MNDTTRWIMIILLLLLIAAAVFMLLRSPGKDKDDKDGADGAAAGVDRRDGDRDGVTGAREERVEPAGRSGTDGVYDQEADTHGGATEARGGATEARGGVTEARGGATEARGGATEARAAGHETHGAEDDQDHRDHRDPADEVRQPVESATYEDPVTAPTESSLYDDTQTTPAETSPYDDTTATEETAEPYRPEAGAVEDDRTAQPDTGASQAGMSDVHPLTDDQIADAGRDEPLTRQESSTTYRAPDSEAVVVGKDQPTDTRSWTQTHGGTQPAPPETADDIVEGHADAAPADADRGTSYAPVFTEAAYGPGSADPLEDGTGPAGWEVKGNIGSMLFHTPESPSYDAVRAEVWFEDEDAARAAGFAHWDRRRR